MGVNDGTVQGSTKIVDNGPDAWRWNLVLVSEGYRATQMGQFHNDAQAFVNTLFTTAPFDVLQAAINVHRLDVTSTDTGADDPVACGGTGAAPATFFDATFCWAGLTQRLLVVNSATAITTVQSSVPNWDIILVLVNSTIYGGSGGPVAVFSMAPGANEIGIHEMGHTAFGLADEYEYYAGCGSGEVGHDHAPAVEPAQPNVTANTNRTTIKWADLILATTPIPTTSNPDCTNCDPQGNSLPSDTVGAYEGANYYHCGAYRPQYGCRMRMLGYPFCAVCRRVIARALTPYLPTKNRLKDLKDVKLERVEKVGKREKLERIEKLEPVEKLGKLEKPEGKEFKEHKPEVEIKTEREVEPWQTHERIERLEAAVERLLHFIGPERRPDLSRGALHDEPPSEPDPPQ